MYDILVSSFTFNVYIRTTLGCAFMVLFEIYLSTHVYIFRCTGHRMTILTHLNISHFQLKINLFVTKVSPHHSDFYSPKPPWFIWPLVTGAAFTIGHVTMLPHCSGTIARNILMIRLPAHTVGVGVNCLHNFWSVRIRFF